MGKKLYVGNLSFDINDQSLADIFAEFGTIESAKVIVDRDSGRSKGFAFVEMSTDEEARNAIGKLDGSQQSGRSINVSEAKPMPPREGGRGGGGGNFKRSRY